MSISIGSNIASLRAQRQLSRNTAQLSTTYERLSSGQRINRASDDAAGLAIANALRVDVRVFGQAIRNLNDGLSLLSIADSAFGELTGILTRIKELAEQSANGIYGSSQRNALDQEAQALRLEHNRIIATTEFNGKSIFQPEVPEIRLQDGYGAEGSLAIVIGGGEDDEIAADIQLSSLSSGGAQGDSNSRFASFSDDGRFIAFQSGSTNLVAGDTNGASDIFVRDQETGTTSRISVSTLGIEGNATSDAASISADGRYIAFRSSANNLVAGDTNGAQDIFVHDRDTGETTRVSVDSGGIEGNAFCLQPTISGDGRYVSFASFASNLVAGDTNGAPDVFVHDRQTGQTTRVSTATGGGEGNGSVSQQYVSHDGRYVVFTSNSTNLVGGDTNGADDIFLHDRQTGETSRVSVGSGEVEANDGSTRGSISDDGRYVSFMSTASNLVANDTNSTNDAFLFDRETGTTVRVSVDSTGAEANGGSQNSMISGNGEFIVFQSNATNLVAGDTNGTTDIFVHKISSGEISKITAGNGQSTVPQISEDGKFIAFQSVANDLVSVDSNGFLEDVFTSNNPLYSSTSLELGSIDISTASDARETLDAVDDHLTLITSERGKIGAFQSRIETARGVRTASSEASSAAESRIRDADIAAESAELTRLNILQRVAASVLAQANQQPALAVRLLT